MASEILVNISSCQRLFAWWHQAISRINIDISLVMFSGIHLKAVHDDVIKWKHFPHYWPFVRVIHQSPVNYPHKSQWCRALMFSLICTLSQQLSKQWRRCWFETLPRSLWRHCNLHSESWNFYSVWWFQNHTIKIAATSLKGQWVNWSGYWLYYIHPT